MRHVLTCADSKFYPLALGLAKTLRLFPDVQLHLYDLGLQEPERQTLEGMGVLVDSVPLPDDMFAMNQDNNIRATHKMDCIEHCLHGCGEGVLVLDADALVIEDIFQVLSPDPDEIIVTYRCDRENKPHILSNGKINTGVMAFGAAVSHAFFEQWRALCRDPKHTDQSALSALLDQEVDWTLRDQPQPCLGQRVRVMDGNEYNDTTCRIGKVIHFKSAGRRANKMLGYRMVVALFCLAPQAVRWLMQMNRTHRFYVWKP